MTERAKWSLMDALTSPAVVLATGWGALVLFHMASLRFQELLHRVAVPGWHSNRASCRACLSHLCFLLQLPICHWPKQVTGPTLGHCGRGLRAHLGGGKETKNLWPFLIHHKPILVSFASWANTGPRKKRFCSFLQFSCITEAFFRPT